MRYMVSACTAWDPHEIPSVLSSSVLLSSSSSLRSSSSWVDLSIPRCSSAPHTQTVTLHVRPTSTCVDAREGEPAGSPAHRALAPLLACYAGAVLGANIALVLVPVCTCMYTRALYGMGHLLIGEGQHPILRLSLGSIETLSGAFRSVSLSLRIVCNAVAGHVLLAVLLEMTCAALRPAMTSMAGPLARM